MYASVHEAIGQLPADRVVGVVRVMVIVAVVVAVVMEAVAVAVAMATMVVMVAVVMVMVAVAVVVAAAALGLVIGLGTQNPNSKVACRMPQYPLRRCAREERDSHRVMRPCLCSSAGSNAT